MSLFPLPKGVQFRLERNQRDFLWEGGNLDRKIHLINCGIVCSSKEKGRLGICNLSILNRALLGKWVWRFAMEENSTWKNVISLNYHTNEGDWFTGVPRGSFGVGLWKDISKESWQLSKMFVLWLGMGPKSVFGGILGMVTARFVRLSLPSLLWLVLKGLRWLKFGIP